MRFGYALLAFILVVLCAVRISFSAAMRLPQPATTALIVAAVALQCCYLLRLPRWAGLALLVMAALVEVPFLAWHQPIAGVPSALAVAILMSLPSPLSWWLVAAMTTAMMSYDGVLKPETSLILYTGTELIDNAMFVFVVLQLLATIRRLHATRARLAELAVVTERLRAAADLSTGQSPGPAAAQPGDEDVSTTVARRAGLAVVIAVSLQELADLRDINRPGWGTMTATALCWVAICVLQYRHSGGGRPSRWPWTLAAQAAVTAALIASPWWGAPPSRTRSWSPRSCCSCRGPGAGRWPGS